MGLANSVGVEYPRRITEDWIDQDTYLARLQKDIWQYVILGYLDFRYDLRGWGPYFRAPLLRQCIYAKAPTGHVQAYVNRQGKIFLSLGGWQGCIYYYDPVINQTDYVLRAGYPQACRLVHYDLQTDLLQMGVMNRFRGGGLISQEWYKLEQASSAQFISSSSTSPVSPHFESDQAPDSVDPPPLVRPAIHFLTFDSTVIQVEGSSYTFLEQGKILRQGQLSGILPRHLIQQIMYYGGYLIILIDHPDTQASGEVQLYQIL